MAAGGGGEEYSFSSIEMMGLHHRKLQRSACQCLGAQVLSYINPTHGEEHLLARLEGRLP
jgi:hypothetical protein